MRDTLGLGLGGGGTHSHFLDNCTHLNTGTLERLHVYIYIYTCW